MQEIDIAILTDRSALKSIQSDWQSCFDRSNASPYLHFDWFRLYQENFDHSGDLRIVVARIGRQVCAIFPFEMVKVKVGPVSENILHFSGDGFAPSSGGVIATGVDVPDIVSASLSALRRYDTDWAFMRLAKVPLNSDLTRSFRHSGMPGSIQIGLPDSWSEYLQALPGSRRQGIKRRIRGLVKSHRAEIVRVGLDSDTEKGTLHRAIDAALRVSEVSWQGGADQGLAISDESCRDFFIAASEQMAKSNALDLSVLFLDDRPASFLWGVSRRPYTSISKLAFDPEFGDLSPGRAHIAMHIEDSIARGFSVIDFGHEFADQKRQWSEKEFPLCELWYFPPGVRPAVYREWFRVRRGVK